MDQYAIGTEVGFGPGDILLGGDPAPGDPAPPTERGTVRLCGFRHIYLPCPCSQMVKPLGRHVQ